MSMHSHHTPIAPLAIGQDTALAFRRGIFFTAVVLITGFLSAFMAATLAQSGVAPLWTLLELIPFTLLTGALVMSFAQAATGVFLQMTGGDPRRITRTVDWSKRDFILTGRTAITIPIFNEDVREVFRRISVMRRSLDATGRGRNFDFFVLSDSSDPNKWIQEEVAWTSMQKGTAVLGSRVYYRRRRPINNKSGNIADFCRRWGRKYRHMIVLDADSFMTGETMVALARLMEANPRAGIIQTVPRLTGSTTWFARAQQFAARLYSPALTVGGNFWQQGDGNFWGHNAILRLAPFIEHCALPKLPGSGAFGGRILSHDFVEAALMRKAGWGVWTAYDLEGSYEGAPPSMLDYLARDRRWCQGNLQHVKMLFAKGLTPASRIHLVLGVLAYVSSPLLVAFIVVSLAAGLTASRSSEGVMLLYAMSMTLIFGTKLMGIAALLMKRGGARNYGGPARLVAGAFCETLLSIFIAPIFLWYHTKFVLFTLAGKKVTWTSQNRDGNSELAWQDAAKEHETQTLSGIVLALALVVFAPGFFWWFAPLLAGLIFSIPISVLTSRAMKVRGDGSSNLFFVPEELEPEPALKHLQARIVRDENDESAQRRSRNVDAALTRAIIDPFTNAVHLSMLRVRAHRKPGLDSLCKRLFRLGPESLTTAWKRTILSDRESMLWLHRQTWLVPSSRLPDWLRIARRHVVESPSSR